MPATRWRAHLLTDPCMANLDPHRSASDLMLLRTPGKARLVTLQFVHVEGEIWVYCECLVCESTDARFFPTSAALEEHLNEPQYRDSFVKWPSIRCSQTSVRVALSEGACLAELSSRDLPERDRSVALIPRCTCLRGRRRTLFRQAQAGKLRPEGARRARYAPAALRVDSATVRDPSGNEERVEKVLPGARRRSKLQGTLCSVDRGGALERCLTAGDPGDRFPGRRSWLPLSLLTLRSFCGKASDRGGDLLPFGQSDAGRASGVQSWNAGRAFSLLPGCARACADCIGINATSQGWDALLPGPRPSHGHANGKGRERWASSVIRPCRSLLAVRDSPRCGRARVFPNSNWGACRSSLRIGEACLVR